VKAKKKSIRAVVAGQRRGSFAVAESSVVTGHDDTKKRKRKRRCLFARGYKSESVLDASSARRFPDPFAKKYSSGQQSVNHPRAEDDGA